MANKTKYLLSLPERTIRASAAVGGGLVAETSQLLLPRMVRDSRLYRATIGGLLRIMIEVVGGVEEVPLSQEGGLPAKDLLKRKAAGNVIELAGILTTGWSPLWLLAAVADITKGTGIYLNTLVADLRSAGALPPDLEITSVEELLVGLEGTSGAIADVVDLPPLKVADMRQTWQNLRQNINELPDAASLAQLYQNLQEVSKREKVPLLTVSTTIATSAIKAGIHLGDVHIFSFYRETLNALMAEGLLPYLRRSAKPYLRGAAKQFNPQTSTYTQRLL
ncbi:MAG: hypothetical protein J0I20_30345 [Chloroflexi bacterium]|nr:hypothetical protein [Chloroflexota bacterium]MBN9396925.1 hypothetical protein [Candidatus Melainabacteria bacterium]OJV92956.1 MAG: hypothetical protein BGO39_03300 [Chloroflexi bacterium 54-19]